MKRTTAIALALFVSTALAGQAEYDRALAKAKQDQPRMLKTCQTLPAAKVKECVDAVNNHFADTERRLRMEHLTTKGAK